MINHKRSRQAKHEEVRRPGSAVMLLLAVVIYVCAALTPQFAAAQDGKKNQSAGELLDDFADEIEAAAEESGTQQEEARKRPPLEIGPLQPLLGQDVDELAEEGPVLAVKPGHWSLIVGQMKANYQDFVGQIDAQVVSQDHRPVALEHTRFGLETTRPVVLAKGKPKRVESDLFAPPQANARFLDWRLISKDTGGEVYSTSPKLIHMPAYEYLLVVLAKEPDQYAFLKATNTVRAPYEEEFAESSQPHYRVALVKSTRNMPLAGNPLQWTEIAYVLWDEVDPTQLTTDQQLALVDWLHWGGRLMVNGPDSLRTLRASFLDPYLPADDAGPLKLSADDLAPWSAFWGSREQGQPVAPLQPTQPLSAIRLDPRPEATELAGGAGMFFERRVGRGSVVVSAVQLSERAVINWPGYDGFLNAGLLRRPRRVFSAGPYGGMRTEWNDYPQLRLDAHFVTPLRFFSRDAQVKANTMLDSATATNAMGMQTMSPTMAVDRAGGMGAWDDFSPVSDASRELLLQAAGVRVPGSAFVIGCLAFYLLILVPFNWLIFHTLQRVEWAWLAVPLIAMLGTWVVVKQAQLDIGFVRSQTEIGLLELQGADPRGMLTRFTALYSSLSTTYEVHFEDHPTALALPFPANSSAESSLEQSVQFQRQKDPSLLGLTVSSASARQIHVEQMFTLDGPIRLGTSSRGDRQLENHSQLKLNEAVLLHRKYNREGQVRYEGTWLGEMRPGDSVLVTMLPVILSKEGLPYADRRTVADPTKVSEQIDVNALLRLACQFAEQDDPVRTDREEYRLVAVIDDPLPGMQIEPVASQVQGATVVVAHLDYGPLGDPAPDVNSAQDVAPQKPKLEAF